MINRIKIEGYKSIRYLDLELKPINILIGSNGVGKSNFLSFFKLVNNLYERRLQNYVGRQGGADNLLYFGRNYTDEIYGKISFKDNIDSVHNNLYYFHLVPTIEDSFIIGKEASGYNVEWMDDNSGYFYSQNLNESAIKQSSSFRDKYLRDYFESLKIFHFHDTGENSPLRKSSQLDDNKYLKENGSNLPAFLYYLKEKHPKHFNRIEKTVQSVAPYFERFDLQPDRLNEHNIRLEWKEMNQSEGYFNALHLSDGTLRFIALVTLLMQPDLPKIIIIDEPELGLHPFAINKLAALIRKASAESQVIISTQSINFVDNFEPEEIITVDRENNASVFAHLNSDNLNNWLSDYTLGDLWQKNVIKGQP
ncbi:AAA family ATPase [Elizabethkingia meningoseptica]|uniref:AAA family ATPase n=1 Tax=Elizabethkingia meningoseptica TaxID=238 RepID=UPI002DD64267|nr:AAA family ATPase [Elizabethkingia meningoseptica]MEC4710394.1 AAA family ATPase [Elizabethkingia meningoseptica]